MPIAPQRPPAGRKKQVSQLKEESFRPHQRYPRLNANAGTEEPLAVSGRRPPRAKPLELITGRKGTPRPGSRFESEVPAPLQATRRLRRSRTRARSSFHLSRWPSLLGLIVTLAAGYWLLNASTFTIARIELKGSRYLNTEAVIKLTAVTRSNVFLLNEGELARQLKTLPYVLEARVSKGLPDKIEVEVKERQPSLNWKSGNLSYLVDQDGIVLESMPEIDLPAEAKGFAVIQSLDERKLNLGDQVDTVAVRSAQAIQSSLNSMKIKVAAVQYSPAQGLTVLSAKESGNWKAVLGTDAQLDKKIDILKGLLADKNLKWSSADLRFVNKPSIQ